MHKNSLLTAREFWNPKQIYSESPVSIYPITDLEGLQNEPGVQRPWYTFLNVLLSSFKQMPGEELKVVQEYTHTPSKLIIQQT